MNWLKGEKITLLIFHSEATKKYRMNPAPVWEHFRLQVHVEKKILNHLTMHVENRLWWSLVNSKNLLIEPEIRKCLG